MTAEPEAVGGRGVRFERTDQLAVLTLCRPERGNALDADVCQHLRQAATAVAADPGVRCVVLRAEGRNFCVGGDLAAFEAAGADRPALVRAMATDLHAAQCALRSMAAPVICLVQGAAAGAGVGLAVSCDLVLAGASAYFQLAYGALALSPDGGATSILPQLIGLRRAQEMAYTNRAVTASEAAGWGLVTRVVEDARLEDEGLALGRAVASGPTAAFGAMKRLFEAAHLNSFDVQTWAETEMIAALSGTANVAEGLRAFRERRRPTFEYGGV